MGLKLCKKCGAYTTNIRKHEARDRCKRQHIRKWKKQDDEEKAMIPNVFFEADEK